MRVIVRPALYYIVTCSLPVRWHVTHLTSTLFINATVRKDEQNAAFFVPINRTIAQVFTIPSPLQTNLSVKRDMFAYSRNIIIDYFKEAAPRRDNYNAQIRTYIARNREIRLERTGLRKC